MIKLIDKYQTFDKKEFREERDATNHVLDCIREILDVTLASTKLQLTPSERYKIVMALVPDDPQRAQDRFCRIYEILSYGID